jgi:hypothetical protein
MREVKVSGVLRSRGERSIISVRIGGRALNIDTETAQEAVEMLTMVAAGIDMSEALLAAATRAAHDHNCGECPNHEDCVLPQREIWEADRQSKGPQHGG